MTLNRLLLAATVILAYLFVWMLIQPDINRQHSPKYHGADAITEGWDGTVTAYRWSGKGYKVMWTRRNI